MSALDYSIKTIPIVRNGSSLWQAASPDYPDLMTLGVTEGDAIELLKYVIEDTVEYTTAFLTKDLQSSPRGHNEGK